MKYEVILSQDAKADLRAIFRYIAYDLQSPHNAASQIERLEEAIIALDDLPERFRVYDKEPWKSRNLRIMPVDHYLVFYFPQHENKIISIVRVLYGSQDIDRQLRRVLIQNT